MVAGRHCYSCKTSRKGDLLGNGSPFSFESYVRSGMGGSASQWVPYAFSGWTFSCAEEIWRTSKWEISWLPFLIFALILRFFRCSPSLQRDRLKGGLWEVSYSSCSLENRFGKCFSCFWDSRWSCLLHTQKLLEKWKIQKCVWEPVFMFTEWVQCPSIPNMLIL